MSDRSEIFQQLLDYCQAGGRVCPVPDKWHELYQMLPNKKRNGLGWEPALPLILGAWWDTPLLLKVLRFREHLEWADDQGIIQTADSFLRSLPEDQWYHGND